ncbi:hypothetical protein CANARDRAFT_194874 [[Candida] arabinofermentans NRRL YB-2248]|uniref:Histone acetyltransferase GCN5 n=1 Tax=[Candida] arabinofermentans NRRL YB-2248 TaxID=983967 RepID=A0A1E4T6D2_9ASCO|nr:hypothetical protein CANARDRAFT_194874 [[Candida] arabinofermentans NRRL YB-2248]
MTEDLKRKASDPKDDRSQQEIKKAKIVKEDEDISDEPPKGEGENDGETNEEEKEAQEEELKRIVTFEFDGQPYTYKERPSVIEEQQGKIEFRVVNNDNCKENMIVLTGLKNIFQKQLPEMPKSYIARLVYDRSHVSIAVVRKPYLSVVGGITIRPFESHEFAEIVFCAISSTEQVRGYGAHLMNHLKDWVRATTKIKYFLTYADNYAIGYFKKQGFTKDITLPKKVWMGYIKDYEGGTLMQCSMLPSIRYLDTPKIFMLQKAAILRKIRSLSQSQVVRPGLKQFMKPNAKPVDPIDIPGVKEAGWTEEMDELAQKPKRGPHHVVMLTILTDMQNHPSNWPFLQPVNREEVPDYYEVIKEPMDLSTMEVKLENDAYESFDDFIYDCKLIFNNCKQYNGENTTFYKNASKLEKAVIAKLKDFPEYSQYIDMMQQ